MLKIKCYSFRGKDEENKKIKGIIDAPSKTIAHFTLSTIGLTKISYLNRKFTSIKKVLLMSLKEKLLFFSQLCLMINAGLSLIDCFKIMQQDAASFKIKYLSYLILKNLFAGKYFSETLRNLYFSPFSSIEIQLIAAAEMSGMLDKTLIFIEKKLQDKLIIQRKFISSLIYPAMTLVIGLIMTFIIFKFIIPQFEVIFIKNKHDFPWLTQMILSTSKHIDLLFIIFFILCFIFFVSIKFVYRRNLLSDEMKEKCIKILPVLGKMFVLVDRVNFCHTFSLLLSAGVPIIEAMTKTNEQVMLPHTKNQLKQALHELASGKSLSVALKKTNFLSRSSLQTMIAAENTGKLEEAFSVMSEQFSSELKFFLEYLGKIIEPFIIILLGAIIGIIVIAVYLPIFQLGSLY